MDYQPFLLGFAVFVAVYLVFFLIRVFADMYLVTVALLCGVAAYGIEGFNFYKEYRELLIESGISKYLSLNLSTTPDTGSIAVVAFFIIMVGVILCLPMLPFSATYRAMLGVERLTDDEERRIRRWVREEIDREEEYRQSRQPHSEEYDFPIQPTFPPLQEKRE
ncbi:hypothetical protein [Thioflexithrix psekupsensis]|uniref:Uncharacterized protein n=1 Tax=Thioflexithrix psekupsensis TaxID=1570016 RepID=A0A251X5A7_9GAMM|nr:hypothetical protein [Thioflexithrix psekupsensis]OUD12389.1 hypothetical protein TPSD3_14860 [Thioflexithrix psekupsensis]